MTDQQLREWYSVDGLDDLLHKHFGGLDFRNWLDVADEGERVYLLMFPEDAPEPGYELVNTKLIDAVAAQSEEVALNRVAEALGIADVEAFRWLMNEWIHAEDLADPALKAIPHEQLTERIAEARRELEEADEKLGASADESPVAEG